ncbi:phage baseplate assembly protein V [Variovorax sp. YR752]|uniref:phage baseplate assembly protein V n=1 Tax=Variovorax sp. YR752 TaxID=1884383 RepID=UPI003137A13E
MSEEAVKFGLRQKVQLKPPAEKVHGVSVATVINNVDSTGEARVQLVLPWLPGFLPWARLALPMAGMLRGTFFVPQIGDEVLVIFHQGDLREPFVIGTLWNTIDRPPSLAPTDAVTQRKIRTPLGHELSFDEATQSVTLTSNTFSKVTLDPLKAQLSTPLATVSIGKDGDVTITAATKITLDAPVIEIKAKTVLTAQSGGTAAVQAGGVCTLRGSSVNIN